MDIIVGKSFFITTTSGECTWKLPEAHLRSAIGIAKWSAPVDRQLLYSGLAHASILFIRSTISSLSLFNDNL